MPLLAKKVGTLPPMDPETASAHCLPLERLSCQPCRAAHCACTRKTPCRRCIRLGLDCRPPGKGSLLRNDSLCSRHDLELPRRPVGRPKKKKLQVAPSSEQSETPPAWSGSVLPPEEQASDTRTLEEAFQEFERFFLCSPEGSSSSTEITTLDTCDAAHFGQ